MGKCAITIDLTESPEAVANKAAEAIRKANGEFTGDANQGSFQLSTPIGSVKGTYTIQEAQVLIQIHDKPMLLTCNRIEQTLRSYLGG